MLAPMGSDSAGSFAVWARDAQEVLRTGGTSDVPCDGCTACCRSSQFVHIAPDEADALAHVPKPLLFPAPGLPAGHVLLGYDERGHCPMLVDDRCSIYEHRPRACRTYDCRVFAATGTRLVDKPLVTERVTRWRFDVDTDADRAHAGAIGAAYAFLADDRDDSGRAVLAIAIHDLFLDGEPDADIVRAEIERRAGPTPSNGRRTGRSNRGRG
jgi:uncharacterized protein